MKISEKCKLAGLKSLAQLCELTNTSRQTLINWERDKPVLFCVVLLGAVEKANKL